MCILDPLCPALFAIRPTVHPRNGAAAKSVDGVALAVSNCLAQVPQTQTLLRIAVPKISNAKWGVAAK